MPPTLKNLPALGETWVRSLSREDPLEKGMAAHSNMLAWRIPWTEEPGKLQSMGSQRVGHDWETSTTIIITTTTKTMKHQHWILCLILFPVSLACVRAKSYQSCPALCDPMDYSLPGSSVHGILRQEYWSGLPQSDRLLFTSVLLPVSLV